MADATISKSRGTSVLWRLTSKRTLTWAFLACMALGGGWHFLFNQSPQIAEATPQTRRKIDPAAQDNATTKPSSATTAKKRPGAGEVSKARPMPATRPAPVPASVTRTSTLSPRPNSPPPPALGPVYRDDVHGFSMHFPARWPVHTFDGEPWILDCGDTRIGLISIGFSPCPPEITAEKLLPEAIARRIKKRQHTTLHGQGRTQIAGKKALWSKSTGPLPMTDAAPRMTRVQYVVPLQDGRVLELRVAAPPENFDALTAMMKKSLETFRVTPQTEGKAQIASSKID